MYIHDWTATLRPKDRVLDLGSGNAPHPRANVCVDAHLEDDTQRDGTPFVRPGCDLVVWDLNRYPYPFSDQEFDFVIASHVAEHLENPLSFCLELRRIGKRGYLEAPSKFYEELYGWPFHKWYVYPDSGVLVFERIVKRTFTGGYVRALYHEKRDGEFVRLHDEHLRELISSYYWEGAFPFRIVWSVPQQAGRLVSAESQVEWGARRASGPAPARGWLGESAHGLGARLRKWVGELTVR